MPASHPTAPKDEIISDLGSKVRLEGNCHNVTNANGTVDFWRGKAIVAIAMTCPTTDEERCKVAFGLLRALKEQS